MPFFRPHFPRPHLPQQPPQNPYIPFFALTGVTFVAFVSGFSACLFDVSQISACVDYAQKAMDMLQKMGQHIVDWFIALVQEVLRRYPLGK